METEEIIILIVALALVFKYVIYDFLISLKHGVLNFPEYLMIFIKTSQFKIFIVSISLIGFIFLNLLIHKKWLKKSKEREEKIKRLESEKKIVKDLLEKSPGMLSLNELKEFIEKLKDLSLIGKYSEDYMKEIQEKLLDAKRTLKERIHEKNLDEIIQKKFEIKDEIEELKKEKYRKQLESDDNKKAVLEHLDIEENNVFEISELNEKEIRVLKEEGFKEINEYDPIQNENISFLVEPVLNHSLTHTFLVGRIKQLLEQYLDYGEIKVHETKDADITFEIEDDIYAFEIETGSLLRKKKQLKEKINYLDKKYGKNWYFIVSNRNLIKNYKEYGRCIQRAGVRKIIEKLTDF